MACIRIDGECPGILTVPDIYTLNDANGREWRFDYHHYLGPSVLKANGDPRVRQPGEKSAFWLAFSPWAKERGLGGDHVQFGVDVAGGECVVIG